MPLSRYLKEHLSTLFFICLVLTGYPLSFTESVFFIAFGLLPATIILALQKERNPKRWLRIELRMLAWGIAFTFVPQFVRPPRIVQWLLLILMGILVTAEIIGQWRGKETRNEPSK